jgi:hypothetical protein
MPRSPSSSSLPPSVLFQSAQILHLRPSSQAVRSQARSRTSCLYWDDAYSRIIRTMFLDLTTWGGGARRFDGVRSYGVRSSCRSLACECFSSLSMMVELTCVSSPEGPGPSAAEMNWAVVIYVYVHLHAFIAIKSHSSVQTLPDHRLHLLVLCRL